MDNATDTQKKVFTNDDYKLRDAVCDFVFDNDLVTQRAIREFRKNKLGSTDYARKTLADLGAKMNNKALTPAQIELAKNLLRQHKNILVQMFADEVKANIAREKAKTERALNTNVALNNIPADADTSFEPQNFVDASIPTSAEYEASLEAVTKPTVS